MLLLEGGVRSSRIDMHRGRGNDDTWWHSSLALSCACTHVLVSSSDFGSVAHLYLLRPRAWEPHGSYPRVSIYVRNTETHIHSHTQQRRLVFLVRHSITSSATARFRRFLDFAFREYGSQLSFCAFVPIRNKSTNPHYARTRNGTKIWLQSIATAAIDALGLLFTANRLADSFVTFFPCLWLFRHFLVLP